MFQCICRTGRRLLLVALPALTQRAQCLSRSVKAKEEEVQRLAVKLDEHQRALPEAQRKVGTQRDHLAVAQHELGEKRTLLEDAKKRYQYAEEELIKVKVCLCGCVGGGCVGGVGGWCVCVCVCVCRAGAPPRRGALRPRRHPRMRRLRSRPAGGSQLERPPACRARVPARHRRGPAKRTSDVAKWCCRIGLGPGAAKVRRFFCSAAGRNENLCRS